MKRFVSLKMLLVLAGGLMISETVAPVTPPDNRQSDFAQALLAKGPAAQLGDAASVYDWLIGSWDVRVIDYGAGGTKRESTGEWHFAWVLEGRAVQDVWISPPRPLRDSSPPQPGNRYGTTLRVYDAGTKAWRIMWNNTASGHSTAVRPGGSRPSSSGSANRSRAKLTPTMDDKAAWHQVGEH